MTDIHLTHMTAYMAHVTLCNLCEQLKSPMTALQQIPVA